MRLSQLVKITSNCLNVILSSLPLFRRETGSEEAAEEDFG